MQGHGIKLAALFCITAFSASALATPPPASEDAWRGATAEVQFRHLPGADQTATMAPLASDQYFFIAGVAFNRWESSASVSYHAAGCIRTSWGDYLFSDLPLPSGATLRGVRLFYWNNGNASDGVSLWVARHPGDGNYDYLLTSASSLDTGYSSEYFALPTAEVIDNAGYAYVLHANTKNNSALCGVRLFFDTP